MSELYDENLFEEEDDLDNIVTLEDDEGNEFDLEFLDLVQYKGKEYVVLLPVESDDDEIVILHYEGANDDGDDSFLSVDDDETLYAVYDVFKEKNKEYFVFDEDEN